MDYIREIQNKIINKLNSVFRGKKHSPESVNYSGSTTKRSMGANYTMEFSSETKKIKEEIDIYRIPYAEKILEKFQEEEGFIVGLNGKKAFLLHNLLRLLNEKPPQLKFKTEPMFIFDIKDVEIYTAARALYKYFGFKNNLPGYDSRAQELYKITSHRKKNIFKGLSSEDIFACKEAMSRDMESINFTVSLSVEFENSKKASQKISDNGANI